MTTWIEFKPVIEWFYTDRTREVWYKGTQDVWSLVSTPTWIPGHKYAINDEHAEARKHFADGYKLGFHRNDGQGSWTSCHGKPGWLEGVKYVVEPQVLNQVLDGYYIRATDESYDLLLANGYEPPVSTSYTSGVVYYIRGHKVYWDTSSRDTYKRNYKPMYIEDGRFKLGVKPDVEPKLWFDQVMIPNLCEDGLTDYLVSTIDESDVTLDGGAFEYGKKYRVVITEVTDED